MTQVPVVGDSKRVHDLQIVLEVTRSLQAEKDLDRLLELILAAASDVVDADRSTLFLVTEEGRELYSKIAEGTQGSVIRFPMGKGIAGCVAETCEPILIQNAYEDLRFNPEVDQRTGYRTSSILCLPLMTHEDKVVGVIQCLNKSQGSFSDYDVQILGALATQAAVAIENANLVAHYIQKQKIQAELSLAREIQVSLLPRKVPEVEGWSIGSRSVACNETGGDYYDFFWFDETHLGFVIGDVSGHGVGASLLMTTARASLRALRSTMTDIEKIVRQLNSFLVEDMDKGMFMTLFLGVLDIHTGRLRYSSSGHDAPLHFCRTSGEFASLESTSLPLGWIDQGFDLEVAERVLEPGDTLILMTDGIWEAMNEECEPFGKDRICDAVRRMDGSSSQEVVDTLFADMRIFCAGANRQDDVTLVAFQRNVRDSGASG